MVPIACPLFSILLVQSSDRIISHLVGAPCLAEKNPGISASYSMNCLVFPKPDLTHLHTDKFHRGRGIGIILKDRKDLNRKKLILKGKGE